MAAVFEQRQSAEVDSDPANAPLISSMFFNTANKNPEWIDFGSQHKPKISPVTGFDTSTGSMRVGFAWHGDFGRCFDEWAYVKAQLRLPH